jgi:DNA-binding response OmpR family regulator
MDPRLNIIVVEDNDDLRDATVEALQRLGHTVCGVDCAEALDDVVGTFRAEVMVLDLNLPGEDGLSIARRMRAANPDIGIIMVTARNDVADIETGYRSGSDIYLTKPTSFEALGAALQALSRRMRPDIPNAAGLILNPVSRQLSGPVAKVDLSDRESSLLAAFAQTRERSLENWQLMELSGKPAGAVTKAALELQIVRLRKKLEHAGALAPTIKAIRGTGYQLCVALELERPDLR